MRKSCRGGRSRHGEKPKELPFGSPLGQYKFIFYSPHPNRWNILIEGGYTLPTKTLPTSRHIRLGFSVVVCGEPRSAPNICLAPLEWGGVVAEQGDRYQCPSATCSCQAGRCYRLSQLSVKVRSVSRYSVGYCDWSGLSLRPSPFDTYIIPHPRANVNEYSVNDL